MMFDSNHGPDWLPELTGPFAGEVAAYIRHMRALGHSYAEPICYMLKRMDDLFADMGCDGTRITRDMADAFCSIEPGQSPGTLANKRSALNGFARYLMSKGWVDVATCEAVARCPGNGFVPYIFTPCETSGIFSAAREAAEAGRFREKSYYTALCLCYTCGLRRSEAANLRVGDFDAEAGAIVVAHSKNDVTRIVPMSRSTAAAVAETAGKLEKAGPETLMLRGEASLGAWSGGLYAFWHRALDAAGIGPRSDGRRQRVHDLRHTFCVRALEKISADGRDVRASLPLLSAYLGHRGVGETEYYLRLAEQSHAKVTEAASSNLPDFYGRGSDGKL